MFTTQNIFTKNRQNGENHAQNSKGEDGEDIFRNKGVTLMPAALHQHHHPPVNQFVLLKTLN